MRITHRPFDASSPDFERMWRFLQQDYADRRDRFIWLDIFFVFIALGFDYLYAEILDWTMRHWGPRYKRLRAEVHEYRAQALVP